MSEISKYNKSDFIRFVMTTIDHNSNDNTRAKEYLSSQGLNVDAIISEGLKRIKRLQHSQNAKMTKNDYFSNDLIKSKANEWVEKILADSTFSFTRFVKEENLVLQNRNLESFTNDDVKNTLVQYFTLKFMEERGSENDSF